MKWWSSLQVPCNILQCLRSGFLSANLKIIDKKLEKKKKWCNHTTIICTCRCKCVHNCPFHLSNDYCSLVLMSFKAIHVLIRMSVVGSLCTHVKCTGCNPLFAVSTIFVLICMNLCLRCVPYSGFVLNIIFVFVLRLLCLKKKELYEPCSLTNYFQFIFNMLSVCKQTVFGGVAGWAPKHWLHHQESVRLIHNASSRAPTLMAC